MNSTSNITRLFFVLIILFANLFLQIVFKYSIYDINISEFNLTYLGNIFNLLLSLLIIIGAILLYYVSHDYDKRAYSTLLFIPSFAIVSYGIGYILATAELDMLNSYIMGVPSRKLYLAIIFLINLFNHYYLFAYIWSNLIGRQSGGSVKAFSGATVALMLTLGFSYYFITSTEYRNQSIQTIPNYDAAVVLGAAVWSNNEPSTVFEGRIKKAHQLSSVGKIRVVQFTGGNAPGEVSEAAAAKTYFNSLGPTSSNIMIEDSTSTTVQQVQFTRNEYFRTNRPQTVVIISDDFHLPRALEMCRFFNISVEGLASDYRLNLEKLLYYRIRESIALVLFWLFGI